MEILRSTSSGPIVTDMQVANPLPPEDDVERQLTQRLATLGARLDELNRTNDLMRLAAPTGFVSREFALEFLQRAFVSQDIRNTTIIGVDDPAEAVALGSQDQEAAEASDDSSVNTDVDEQFSDPDWLSKHPDIDDRFMDSRRQKNIAGVEGRERQRRQDDLLMIAPQRYA